MNTSAICKDDERRDTVRRKTGMNGLDYLDVGTDQLTLTAFFLGKAPSQLLRGEGEDVAAYKQRLRRSVRVEGGRRVRGIQVEDVEVRQARDPRTGRLDPLSDDRLVVRVDKPGDFSTYTLRLVGVENIDPFYDHLDFTFKVDCPSDLDCAPAETCPPPTLVEPEINYLAKDYGSFRQLILDRLALIMPDWKERHVPDIGIALVELLAYVGDHLSYYQDAIATEAYLDTARQRISVRRHARLVDYHMHEGCNARAWVCVETDTNLVGGDALDPNQVFFVTGYNDALSVVGGVLAADALRQIPADRYEVFEPIVQSPEVPLFELDDLKNPATLVAKLRNGKDALSQYLRERLSSDTRRMLDQYDDTHPPSEALQKALIEDFNRLLQSGSLYDKQRFAQVQLTEETQKLIEQKARGKDLMRLNRWLLEEAYPHEIAWSKRGYLYFYQAHNEICFYTWGQHECCVPRGATSATLKETCMPPPPPLLDPLSPDVQQSSKRLNYPAAASPPPPPERQLHLQAGDVLIFEEVIGPHTGNPADADPSRRHAVRLTKVTQDEDALYDPPVPIVEIEWAAEDALPFTLCISAITDAANDCKYVENISVARGNVILVDHGRTLEPPQDLGVVPCVSTRAECDCADHPSDTSFIPGRYRPKLDRAPLTFRHALPPDDPQKNQFVAARRLLLQDVREAAPQVALSSTPAAAASNCEELRPLYRLADLLDPASLISILRDTSNLIARQLRARFSKETLDQLDQPGDHATLSTALIQELNGLLQTWGAQPDLLSSQPDDWHFVVEIDNDGYGNLRFGDGALGRQPEAGSSFFATYRVGNGTHGNVGAEAISHLVFRDASRSGLFLRVRNPLPSQGGTDPEPIAEVKLFAPFASRKDLQRAITAEDYAQLVQRDFKDNLQRAAATLNWTGSWYEARVSIDPFGAEEVGQDVLDTVERRLERFRRIGHDLNVMPAQYVSVEIEMIVCVLPHYLRGHVEAALLEVFSNRILPNGKRGFFHPDNLMFGDGIYLSQLIATAQAVTGVESVAISRLQRLYAGDNGELEKGVLPLGPLEVARLDNDPSFPEHGRFMLDVRGGR